VTAHSAGLAGRVADALPCKGVHACWPGAKTHHERCPAHYRARVSELVADEVADAFQNQWTDWRDLAFRDALDDTSGAR
jgi:hypothetical protein